MAEDASLRFLLIVTGSTLRAEKMDRPLAYYLQRQLEEALEASRNADLTDYEVHVVADFRWLHDDSLQGMPTISLGGPGVNELTHRWLEEVPVALAVNERYFIQLDPELAEPHASVWGMDNATTQIAVSVFLDRFLPRFLERSATIPPASLDLDDEGEPDPDDD